MMLSIGLFVRYLHIFQSFTQSKIIASFQFPSSDFHETLKTASLVIQAHKCIFARGCVRLSPTFPISTIYSTVHVLDLRWYTFSSFPFPEIGVLD